MPEIDEKLLFRVGSGTVAENLKRSVEKGLLIENEDGTWSLPPREPSTNWAKVSFGPRMNCVFLLHFLFGTAYDQSAVPDGCRECYKVKVVPKTLRQLVAAWNIAKRIECQSKWGVDLDNRYSQDIYAGYFYTSGLPMARAIFRIARDAFNKDPKLGSDVVVKIKRGCSDYEAVLGPSDQYQFAPELKALEEYLARRFRNNKRNAVKSPPLLPLMNWIDVAFRIGDDTDLDFTGGQPWQPKTVTYDPV